MDQDDIVNVSLTGDQEKSQINISDVIDVIRTTDPTAQVMFNSGTLPQSTTIVSSSATIGATTAPASTANNQQTQPQQQLHNFNNNNNTQTQTQTHTNVNVPSMNNSSSGNSPRRQNAYVKITEQPASKALRFRYECEGRSAGSIPGVNSTPENKTYPSIQIVGGYRGRAVAVVSCVTKDPPYRPHPHNLVGKDSCKKGVCTVEINNETMSATFSNLGIQCVKKKDIEEALRVRENIRVDPYRTGFAHRSQPSSIDLNAVRLCFQVFLESNDRERTSFTVPLTPIVSDPIYDKKAMSDLVICKLSKPSCTVAGGDEMILLCEKVAKEDISVRFFEENQGVLLWEGYGDFQHSNVHKQVAISFRTPKYKSIDIEQPVKCFIQLKRPSDGATSEALPFEYLPLDSGRRSLLALRKGLKVKGNFEQLGRFLSLDEKILEITIANGNEDHEKAAKVNVDPIQVDVNTAEQIEQETTLAKSSKASKLVEDMDLLDSNEKTTEWLQKTEFTPVNEEPNTVSTTTNSPQSLNMSLNTEVKTVSPTVSRDEEDKTLSVRSDVSIEEDKTLNELLEQVAELDEIYSGYQINRNHGTFSETKLGNRNNPNAYFDELFDDAATYTSLQRAFKNPVPIADPSPPSFDFDDDHKYDVVEPLTNSTAPVIDISSPLKRDNVGVGAVEEEKLPPLPPKRLRKITAENTEYNANLNPKENDNDSLNERSVSQIIIKRTPDQLPLKNRSPLTSNPSSTQSSPQKKQGFFSRIFRRKSKSDMSSNCATDTKNSPNISREPSINHFEMFDRNRLSTRSCRSPQSPTKKGKPVGRSVSSVSGKRPHLTADIVHIPLKGLSSDSLPMRSGSGSLMPDHYSSRVTLSNNLDRKTVSALQLADLPLQQGNMELIAIADAQSLKNLCEGKYGVHLDADVDLSEAEHFALYTSVAPHATESEFDDEMSTFYAPAEEAEVVPNSEIAKRLAHSGQAEK